MDIPVVLCVDDEPIILQSLRIELRNALAGQCAIETAESGEEALDILQNCGKTAVRSRS